MASLPRMAAFRHVRFFLVALAAACSSEPPPRATDTSAVDTAAPAEEAAPTPQPDAAASKIGQIPLVRPAPAQGSCRSVGTVVEPRYALDADEYPARSITVGEGAATRSFLPSFVEIRARQTASGGIDEHETLFAIFSPDGRIETGTRQYFNSANPPTRETGGLLGGDTAALRDIALSVLQKCKPAAPATP